MTTEPRNESATARIDAAWDELLNVDDRTSPEEYPDMCLITRDELAGFMTRGHAKRAALPQDKWGETAIERMNDHAENGTMKPQDRADLRRLLALAQLALTATSEAKGIPMPTIERYDVVDYLRQGGEYIEGVWYSWDGEMAGYALGFADMIEAGKHWS